MESSQTEFFRARTRAQLSCSDAADLLEIPEEDVGLLDAGVKLPAPRLLSVLNGFGLKLAGRNLADEKFDNCNLLQRPSKEAVRSHQSEFGQFFTPEPIAKFMAGLFSKPSEIIRLLDAGAGEGALTKAFVDRWEDAQVVRNIEGSAYELDGKLLPRLKMQLSDLGSSKVVALAEDFLEQATAKLSSFSEPNFTHAILNPPYKKIGASSVHRRLTRQIGFETVNLYSAFVGAALALLEKGGELVAIVPRSFCNGPYYFGFRKFILERSSLKHLHVFGRRDEAFAKDGVLQENVILKLIVGEKQENVTVSKSSDHTFLDYSETVHSFADVVNPDDKDLFVHVPILKSANAKRFLFKPFNISELNLKCSTGPIVDFRVRQDLQFNLAENGVPLLYPMHFSSGRMIWPKVNSKKPNAIEVTGTTRNSLWPKGYYTVVRRFSSKEEKRRVFAAVVEPSKLPTDLIGFENHFNVFHFGKKPIEPHFAWGLAAFLNSSLVDEQIRSFSGHTQVNSTDLRRLNYPSLAKLENIGRWYLTAEKCSQQDLDAELEGFLK